MMLMLPNCDCCCCCTKWTSLFLEIKKDFSLWTIKNKQCSDSLCDRQMEVWLGLGNNFFPAHVFCERSVQCWMCGTHTHTHFGGSFPFHPRIVPLRSHLPSSAGSYLVHSGPDSGHHRLGWRCQVEARKAWRPSSPTNGWSFHHQCSPPHYNKMKTIQSSQIVTIPDGSKRTFF